MSMNDATDTQFRILDDGTILYQADATNPLPGAPVARVTKGDAMLAPAVLLLDGTDAAHLPRLQAFATAHIATVLAPVLACAAGDGMTHDAARTIAARLADALGVLPRTALEVEITQLDPDGRKQLRDKGVRLGPVLIYLPLLNKPAAVRLRALLWSLWHGGPLPAPVPHDGAVSQVVDAATANADFFQSIGYPLYGPRICRIDMLDRVMTEIYDTAKDGKFMAQHKMAEWLGCSIADLYAILTAMGHRLLHDPATVPAAEVPEGGEAVPVAETAELKPVVKPELATFLLRRGRASGGNRDAKPRTERPAKPEQKPKADFTRKKKPQKPVRMDEPRSFSAPSKTEREDSNPFAALKGLKF